MNRGMYVEHYQQVCCSEGQNMLVDVDLIYMMVFKKKKPAPGLAELCV